MQVFSRSGDSVHEAGTMCTRSATELLTDASDEEMKLSLHGLAVNMARHCTRVQYFPSPSAQEKYFYTLVQYLAILTANPCNKVYV